MLAPTGTAEADLLALELSDTPADLPPVATDDLSGPTSTAERPGSEGEHRLQQAYGTAARAERFYRDQVLDHLNEKMIEFVGRMEMAFVATSDAGGECDSSLRAGPKGFIRVFDERTVGYPEYRGNGVVASLGNISENAHIGILMVDFVDDLIGLHINGDARIVADADLRAARSELPTDAERGRTPERWVLVEVTEAYIHCRKHIPRLVPADRVRAWGTDDPIPKGGDYFGSKAAQRAAALAAAPETVPVPPQAPGPDLPRPVVAGPATVATRPFVTEPFAAEPISTGPFAAEPIAAEPIETEPIETEPVPVATVPVVAPLVATLPAERPLGTAMPFVAEPPTEPPTEARAVEVVSPESPAVEEPLVRVIQPATDGPLDSLSRPAVRRLVSVTAPAVVGVGAYSLPPIQTH
jgi:hypothetical protein